MSRSTGPRTPRGKARSSQNSAKHWIESKRILPEEQKEAAILRNGFAEDFKPDGLIEHEIIDDFTLNRLHKRRIDIVFAKEFYKATIKNAIKLDDNNLRPAARYWLRQANLLRGHSDEPAERVDPKVCINELRRLTKEIRDLGPQPGHLEFLREIYGDQPTPGAALSMNILAELEGLRTEKDEAAAAIRRNRKGLILDALRAEIESQEVRQSLAEDLVAIECLSELQEPPHHTLETLLRYRAANSREFTSLLESFERIRRLRRTSATPTRADDSP